MIILILILFISFSSSGQSTDDLQLESIANNQLIGTEATEDNIGMIDNYTQQLVHRTDLNSAHPEQLRLLGLSELQIQELVHHKARNGNLVSMYELQSLDGFDTTSIRKLMRIATVKDPANTLDEHFFKRVKSDGYAYALLRADFFLEKKKGFTDAATENQQFSGPPARYAFRFRSFRSGDFSFGITAENDPGEKITWQPSKSIYGFDYIAVHAQIQNKGMVRNLVVGDYQAQFGQGLVWGGAMAFGKGAEAITNVRRANAGIVPYTSSYESGYLHGAAASLSVRQNFTIHALLSSSRKDASIAYNRRGSFISSFPTTGLHRTRSELEKRKNVTQQVAGLVVEFEKPGLLAGMSWQYRDLEFPVLVSRSLYNQFGFHGTQQSNINAYLNYTHYNVSFFAEGAATAGHGKAIVAGSLISLATKFDMSVLYRNYSRDFWPVFSNAFAEGTTPANERGLYWGWKYKLNRRYYLSGYMDFFMFPWLKYRTYSPVRGSEWLLHLHWQPARSTTLFFQVRQENKARNASDNSSLYVLNPLCKNSYWFHAEHYVTPALRLKTRVQWSTFSNRRSVSEGFAGAQDISVTAGKLKVTARYALFETDDYDNRQYMYENDVWLSYSLPAYYGKGVRKYLLLQYKCTKTVTVWMRIGHTRFLNRNSIGSGSELIYGDEQNDVKFEARIHL